MVKTFAEITSLLPGGCNITFTAGRPKGGGKRRDEGRGEEKGTAEKNGEQAKEKEEESKKRRGRGIQFQCREVSM